MTYIPWHFGLQGSSSEIGSGSPRELHPNRHPVSRASTHKRLISGSLQVAFARQRFSILLTRESSEGARYSLNLFRRSSEINFSGPKLFSLGVL